MIERIEINLLPAEYRVHRKKFQIKREVAYPLLIAGVIAVGLSLWTVALNNTIVATQNQLRQVSDEIQKNRPIQQEINKLQNDQTSIKQKIHALELINVNREKWVRLMEEFNNRLPPYTWMVSIKEELRTPPVIHIEGRTHSFPEVANFMSNLNDCNYVISVDLSEIEQIDSENKIFKFSISCAINDNAYLTDQPVAMAGGDSER